MGVLIFVQKTIQLLSTIGAGDNFNAGLAYGIYKHNIGFDTVKKGNQDVWQKIVPHAIKFSAKVCTLLDNYIPLDFAQEYTNEINSKIK